MHVFIDTVCCRCTADRAIVNIYRNSLHNKALSRTGDNGHKVLLTLQSSLFPAPHDEQHSPPGTAQHVLSY